MTHIKMHLSERAIKRKIPIVSMNQFRKRKRKKNGRAKNIVIQSKSDLVARESTREQEIPFNLCQISSNQTFCSFVDSSSASDEKQKIGRLGVRSKMAAISRWNDDHSLPSRKSCLACILRHSSSRGRLFLPCVHFFNIHLFS